MQQKFLIHVIEKKQVLDHKGDEQMERERVNFMTQETRLER